MPKAASYTPSFYIESCLQFEDMRLFSYYDPATVIDITNDVVIPYANEIKDDDQPILLIVPGSAICDPHFYAYLPDKLAIPAFFIPHRGSPNTKLPAPSNNHEMLLPTLKAIDLFVHRYPNRTICVYGHSLGGAIAAEAVLKYANNPNVKLITDRSMSSMSETISFKASMANNLIVKCGMHVTSWFTTSKHFFNFELYGRECFDKIDQSRKINFYLDQDPNLGPATIQSGNLLVDDGADSDMHMRNLLPAEIAKIESFLNLQKPA